MVRLCLVIGLVMDRCCGEANYRRLAIERRSLSTNLIAIHNGISFVAWYLGTCVNCAVWWYFAKLGTLSPPLILGVYIVGLGRRGLVLFQM